MGQRCEEEVKMDQARLKWAFLRRNKMIILMMAKHKEEYVAELVAQKREREQIK